MMRNLKNLSMILAVLFVASALVMAYKLYALPGELQLEAGYGSVLGTTYTLVAVTFLLALTALYVAMKDQREVIVYKEKAISKDEQSGDTTEGSKTTISLDAVKQAVGSAHQGKALLDEFLQAVCKQLEAGQGGLYTTVESEGTRKVVLTSGYALAMGEGTSVEFAFGEGLIGQAASEGRSLYVDDIPEGYIKIISGLGSASPRFLLIVPIKQQTTVRGVVEIASFTPFDDDRKRFVEASPQLLAEKITS